MTDPLSEAIDALRKAITWRDPNLDFEAFAEMEEAQSVLARLDAHPAPSRRHRERLSGKAGWFYPDAEVAP